MSRFDQPSEPDFDRYEFRADEDIDVPDFTAPDPPKCTCWLGTASTFGDSYQRMQCAVHGESAQVIDPAEHAAHALIDAFTTLEQQLVLAPTLARWAFLKELTRRAFQHADLVDQKATAQRELILERLR